MRSRALADLIGLGMPGGLASAVSAIVTDDPVYRPKLVCFDASRRTTATVQTYIANYEQMPFDGMIIDAHFAHGQLSGAQPLSNWNSSNYAIDWNSLQTSLTEANATAFRRFGDNFIMAKMTVVSPYALFDWYSNDSRAFVWNMRMAARFAQAAHFQGVFFDMEPDNATATRKLLCHADRPFASTYTLAEYQARVKKIAREAMEAMQDEFPTMKLIISFSYEQAIKQHNPPVSADNYSLLAPLLDGLFDARAEGVQVHCYYEDGYNHYTDTQIAEDLEVQKTPDLNVFGTEQYFEGYYRGYASYVDGLGATNLPIGIKKGIEQVTEKYSWVYSNSDAFMGASGTPTVSQAVIDAVEGVRIEVGFNQAFDPAGFAGLIGNFDPGEMAGLGYADDDPIESYTDDTGVIYTQTGANRPLYKTDGIDTGIPGALFAKAGSQNLLCNLLATRLEGASDIPFTWVGVAKCTTNGAGEAFWGIGRGATTDPEYSMIQTSGNVWRFVNKEDGAGNAVTDGTPATDTDAHVFTLIYSGTVLNMRLDGANILATNPYKSLDYGATTFGQARLGSRAKNSIDLYFGGTLGHQIFYKYAHGLDAVRQMELALGREAGITVAGA